ncbi:hypothetical protein HYALB_00007588 [Hymenoscyphus albidus]|uniref:Uncharacterized protein n=1 Tax=Hymenoscyphus albidus TaxID=595503 RepID=A0A9N9Q4D4_9HELO|nr:hypothetical protein HYALB_00007588 [Hymenoscyphus albidus]
MESIDQVPNDSVDSEMYKWFQMDVKELDLRGRRSYNRKDYLCVEKAMARMVQDCILGMQRRIGKHWGDSVRAEARVVEATGVALKAKKKLDELKARVACL